MKQSRLSFSAPDGEQPPTKRVKATTPSAKKSTRKKAALSPKSTQPAAQQGGAAPQPGGPELERPRHRQIDLDVKPNA